MLATREKSGDPRAFDEAMVDARRTRHRPREPIFGLGTRSCHINSPCVCISSLGAPAVALGIIEAAFLTGFQVSQSWPATRSPTAHRSASQPA